MAEASLIEMGWILAGRLEPEDRQAVEKAHQQVHEYMEGMLPGFTWKMPVVERREFSHRTRAEPVVLLDLAVIERETRHWDFALVITSSDLKSYYKPYALATPASSISIAVLSTSRVDPQVEGSTFSNERRVEILTGRIFSLVLHLFGHLNGLQDGEDPTNFMFDLNALTDLDKMGEFEEDQLTFLKQRLQDVADIRLEEQIGSRTHPFNFYVRSLWVNRRDIVKAVLQGRPWEFPLRLSRLTIAALSTLLILIMTAETWDLGTSRPPIVVISFSLVTLVLTSLYILHRQKLLVRRGTSRLSEQTVITNASMVIIVVSGMVTTYVLLFGVVLLLAALFFGQDLVTAWAPSLQERIETRHYVVFAGFIAALGLTIGALAASFEEHHYFRHIAYVDEET